MRYTPHSKADIEKMLGVIGVSSIDDLFGSIPANLKIKDLNIPSGKSESQIQKELEKTASLNCRELKYFAGGGFYRHHIPAAVDMVSSRTEYRTAYTPYQPEASQGTLQALYEYQTSVCRLTGKEVANASLYDGGTALAEAVIMASNINRRKKVIIDSAVNPLYREILKTYTENLDIEITEIFFKNYRTDRKNLLKELDNKTSSVVLQNPNFFGAISNYTDLVEKIHSAGALAIGSVYPVSLGLLKTPGDMGFDIVTGEGQSLGNPLNFGGPYLGLLAADRKYLRKMPGRIAGRSKDKDGNTGYLLTLQAREQHIRRERAGSNICTNQNLMALRAQIYLSLLGKSGYRKLALDNYKRARQLREELKNIPSITVPDYGPVFNEFIIELPEDAAKVNKRMLEKNIFSGIPLGKFYPDMNRLLLVCATEFIDSSDIENYIKTMRAEISS